MLSPSPLPLSLSFSLYLSLFLNKRLYDSTYHPLLPYPFQKEEYYYDMEKMIQFTTAQTETDNIKEEKEMKKMGIQKYSRFTYFPYYSLQNIEKCDSDQD